MEKDLTTGNITPQLIRFTIPLVLGNIFQLMYNAIDSIIVGRFVGSHALAAVGICNPISTLFILFLNGLCMGASILMGNMFGAKEYDKLHRQISTTMLSGIVFSLVLSILCILFAHPILTLMQVDFVIIPMTKLYLRIIFSGLIFTFMYNCFASTLRALGDSKSPLYFLIISSVVNVFGDLIFVLIFHMGSEGCAMTALMAQNKGARKTDRIKAAFRCGMKIELFYGIFIFFVCFFLAHPLMQLFSNDPVVCKHGVTYLKLISLMYLFPAVTNGVQGYFRGIGDLKITLISSFVNMSVRVIFAAVLVFHFSLQIEALPFSYLAGWIGMLLAEVPLLLRKF